MKESQELESAKLHELQVREARVEFHKLFPRVLVGFSTEQRVCLEIIFWNFFLHAKGLKK